MAITNQFTFDDLNLIPKSELLAIIRKYRKDKFGKDEDSDDDKRRSMPYREYFGDMYLEPEEKEKRIEMSKDLEYVFLFLFAYIATHDGLGDMTYSEVYQKVDDACWDVVGQYVTPEEKEYIKRYTRQEMEDHIRDYLSRQTRYIVDNTMDNLDDDAYYISEDRATLCSENQVNGVANAEELYEALDEGYTIKTWRTMEDNKVRDTHQEVDGDTKPINEAFIVGDSELLYPGDDSLGASPEEICNCRCTVEYGYDDSDADPFNL